MGLLFISSHRLSIHSGVRGGRFLFKILLRRYRGVQDGVPSSGSNGHQYCMCQSTVHGSGLLSNVLFSGRFLQRGQHRPSKGEQGSHGRVARCHVSRRNGAIGLFLSPYFFLRHPGRLYGLGGSLFFWCLRFSNFEYLGT